ncbi:HNH endonuclease [Selenomonas sp. AE3005]|uniref:HNH endonuclease n=1 Tax=Selenomonas sp. AE3005 TaxID=1485543 RepID=UPI00068B8F2C|nr:HNH endonuclease [Selenomonas sp. AE3005]
MKHVEIHNRKHEIVGYAKVSDIDYEAVNQYNWTKHNKGYVCAKINGVNVLLHRFIMELKHGHANFAMVDHINHRKTDNRRENLRLVDAAANARNRMKSQGKASKYKGVTRKRLKNGEYRYIARIFTTGHELHYLGSYVTEEAAAMAYNKAAIEYFGDYACINDEIIA